MDLIEMDLIELSCMERRFGRGVRVTYRRRRRRRGSFSSGKMRGGAKTRHGGNDWARGCFGKTEEGAAALAGRPLLLYGWADPRKAITNDPKYNIHSYF